MKNVQKLGGFAALYLAVAYAIGIALFLVVLDYPHIVEPAHAEPLGDAILDLDVADIPDIPPRVA